MCSLGVVDSKSLFLKTLEYQLFSHILTVADGFSSFSFLSMNVSIANEAAEMMSETFIADKMASIYDSAFGTIKKSKQYDDFYVMSYIFIIS